MFGLSSTGKDAIATAIEKMFDRLALNLVGEIPKLRDKKLLLFGANPGLSLSNIFLQAMDNREPNYLERDTLKSMLNSAHGYVESLKNKTKSNVVESIDALAKEAKAQGKQVTPELVRAVFSTEMGKAQSHLKTITEAETTKTRNIGHTMDISKVAGSLGDSDPTVFFVIVRDGDTCKECLRLHMMPDGNTPRLWKLSQLSAGFHKRGEDRPSMCGEHPYCRCSLTYMASGFGFKNGFVSWIAPEYNAYKEQQG